MEKEVKSLVNKLKSVFLKENAIDFLEYVITHKDEGDFGEFKEWLQGGQLLEIGKDWSIDKEEEKEMIDIKAVTAEVARLTELNTRKRQELDELVARLESGIF